MDTGEAAASETEDERKTPTRVRATTTVFVRSEPTTDNDGNKLGKAREGDEFTSLGEENGWTRVIYNDSEAYIKSDYVEAADNTGEAE